MDVIKIFMNEHLNELTLFLQTMEPTNRTYLFRKNSMPKKKEDLRKRPPRRKSHSSISVSKTDLKFDIQPPRIQNKEYFELQLKKVKLPLVGQSSKNEFIQLVCKNITTVIKNQQKKSDKIYQDAIETNFSHEQMNPLNVIITSANSVNRRFMQMQNHLQQDLKKFLQV